MAEPAANGFEQLAATCAAAGPDAMFDELAASLAASGRWHAVFDARLAQARLALGLSATGGTEQLEPAVRDRLEDRTLAACREVGWPLLEAGRVREAWMYLRAAAEPAEVAARLEGLAKATSPAAEAEADDEEAARRLEEIVAVALWEGVDPALGIGLVLRLQGTCNAITAYEQAVAGLPAPRQPAAAATLVAHLHGELAERLAADLAGRGLAADAAGGSIVALLAAAGGLRDDPAVHVDVSHLHAVLRFARVCGDEPTIRRAWELACYAARLPAEFVQPGEPPFEDAAASRAFFGAQLGIDVEPALDRFRRAAIAGDAEAGTLPRDTLVLLLWRLGRAGDALRAALAHRPREDDLPRARLPAGLLPSLVDLAATANDWDALRQACRDRGDEVTFAATLAAERHQRAG
jgi:hypothetical protein